MCLPTESSPVDYLLAESGDDAGCLGQVLWLRADGVPSSRWWPGYPVRADLQNSSLKKALNCQWAVAVTVQHALSETLNDLYETELTSCVSWRNIDAVDYAPWDWGGLVQSMSVVRATVNI